ncbi:hypothetical protein D3C86_1940110 [compost metagenome]
MLILPLKSSEAKENSAREMLKLNLAAGAAANESIETKPSPAVAKPNCPKN